MRGPCACPGWGGLALASDAMPTDRIRPRTSTRPPHPPNPAPCPYRTRTPHLHSPIRSVKSSDTVLRHVILSAAKDDRWRVTLPSLTRVHVVYYSMNEKIQSVLNSLPHKPGIYIMKDASGTILYVGKAISLYNRVRSYFQESTDLSPKNRSMVAKIDDIEFLVVKNEVETLVLESNYIKQYRPKYNVLMRDDKSYPYIKVSLAEDFPRVYRVRSFQRDGNRYFGPYTNSGAVDATLDLLNKLFAFRTCRYDGSAWAPPRNGEAPA